MSVPILTCNRYGTAISVKYNNSITKELKSLADLGILLFLPLESVTDLEVHEWLMGSLGADLMLLTQFEMPLLTSGCRKSHYHYLLTFNEVVNAIVRGLSEHKRQNICRTFIFLFVLGTILGF